MGQVITEKKIDAAEVKATIKELHSLLGQNTFGSGRVHIFLQSGTFNIPPFVRTFRVSVQGAGGGAMPGAGGGGGGGFATGIINVGNREKIEVTVGKCAVENDGYWGREFEVGDVSTIRPPNYELAISSFGNYMSATGGRWGENYDSKHSGHRELAGGAGGIGIGGDYQKTGGAGGKSWWYWLGGGGGSAGFGGGFRGGQCEFNGERQYHDPDNQWEDGWSSYPGDFDPFDSDYPLSNGGGGGIGGIGSPYGGGGGSGNKAFGILPGHDTLDSNPQTTRWVWDPKLGRSVEVTIPPSYITGEFSHDATFDNKISHYKFNNTGAQLQFDGVGGAPYYYATADGGPGGGGGGGSVESTDDSALVYCTRVEDMWGAANHGGNGGIGGGGGAGGNSEEVGTWQPAVYYNGQLQSAAHMGPDGIGGNGGNGGLGGGGGAPGTNVGDDRNCWEITKYFGTPGMGGSGFVIVEW